MSKCTRINQLAIYILKKKKEKRKRVKHDKKENWIGVVRSLELRLVKIRITYLFNLRTHLKFIFSTFQRSLGSIRISKKKYSLICIHLIVFYRVL